MADRYDDQYSSPEALRLAKALGVTPKGKLTASNPDLTGSNAALAKQVAARMAAQKAANRQEEYELARDADGNTILVPKSAPEPKKDRNRVMEGITEGFGEQPLSGVSERDRENYPTMSRYVDPVAKALNAVVRAPGAVVGGASGAYGAGVEAATGDSGYANAEQRRMREFLDYLGINSAATMGGARAPAPARKVDPTTQYAMRYESIPPEGAIGPVQAPVGSARNPEMGGQVYSQNVARQARIDDIIKQAAGDTAQTRQNSAVQDAINAAAQRAREGMPREMNADEIAAMQRSFAEKNPPSTGPSTFGGAGRQMTADEIAAMQRSFAGANPPSASPMSLPVATGTVVAGAMTRPGQGTPPSSGGMDRAEDADFYRSVGAARLPSSEGIDRNEDENFYRNVGAARFRSSAGMDQTDYPMRSPAVSAAKKQVASKMPETIDLNSGSSNASSPGILSRIFSGKDYQSNSRPVMEDETVNWGNPDSAADFFRADKARMAMEGRASGGSVNGKPDKDAALHKALEIIHHMIRSR